MSDPAATRLERALIAFVRQEFGAPTAAIVGFAEILLDDVRRQGLDGLVEDLERIRAAGLRLQGLLADLLERPLVQKQGADFAAFKAQLRHDLRTPLSAVKGYGEMLVEEAEEGGHQALLHDLAKLLGAADQLLGRIDTIGEAAPGAAEEAAGPRDVIGHLIETIRPLAPEDQAEQVLPSRILVVDDTETNRDLLCRRLIREGHFVDAVGDGQAALARLAEDDFDLVLLDLIMPRMNGFEVLCRIKADPRTRDIPVIMISALDEFDSVVRCIEAGAEDYLPKPFNPVLLRARINAGLEKKRLRDRERSVLEQLRVEKEKSEALLLNILPRTIVSRMRQGEVEIADRYDEVSILFSDLVGFTTIASRFPASRVIDLLNRVFSKFDAIANQHGLEKIKTIGDAYMVAGGLPEPHPDHAAATAKMGLRMVDIVRETGEALGMPLQIRIGIHTGAAIAGVIGRHRFIYDVWGDTVNTASRMETYGLPNRVHISAATWLRVKDAFPCEPRGPTEIKGKGTMQTYLLGDRRAAARPS
jgi:class 3 adenylate cyclase